MSAKLLGLEAIVLDSIELFANSSGVLLPRISDALEISAVDLSAVGKTPTHNLFSCRGDAVNIQADARVPDVLVLGLLCNRVSVVSIISYIACFLIFLQLIFGIFSSILQVFVCISSSSAFSLTLLDTAFASSSRDSRHSRVWCFVERSSLS
ncbi:hypothetical protein TMatcc_008359 [Talaromyces marneffei ATCC 18224]